MTWPQSLQPPWSWHRFRGAHLPESRFQKPTVTRYWSRQGECSEDDSALRMQSGTRLVPRELSILVQDPASWKVPGRPSPEKRWQVEGRRKQAVRTQGMELIRYRIRKTQPSRREGCQFSGTGHLGHLGIGFQGPAGHEEVQLQAGCQSSWLRTSCLILEISELIPGPSSYQKWRARNLAVNLSGDVGSSEELEVIQSERWINKRCLRKTVWSWETLWDVQDVPRGKTVTTTLGTSLCQLVGLSFCFIFLCIDPYWCSNKAYGLVHWTVLWSMSFFVNIFCLFEDPFITLPHYIDGFLLRKSCNATGKM